MKMGCLFCSGMFWGVLLILLGISIILKVLFNITIPIFRIAFALLLIYLGVKILTGGFGIERKKNTVLFNDSKIEYTESSDEYNVLFGKGVVNLSNVSLEKKTVEVKVNTVFAEGTIRINPALPTKILVNSAFAGARMPDGNVISFGNYTYKTKSFKENENYLKIEANVVFGSLKVVEG